MKGPIGLLIENTIGEQIQKEQNGAKRLSDVEFIKLLDETVLHYIGCTNESTDTALVIMSKIKMPERKMIIIDGVFDTLSWLKEAGYQMAIVSNNYKYLMDYLLNNGLADYFNPIIISELVGFEKPDPRIMQLAVNQLNVLPGECLYVGDHLLDIECAKKSGLDMAWVCNDTIERPTDFMYKENFRINKVSDLLKFL